jgi:hypothetical protein
MKYQLLFVKFEKEVHNTRTILNCKQVLLCKLGFNHNRNSA